MLLQFGALGVTMSWDEGFPGARASRPHQAWHSLGYLPHLDQPGTAPWLSFGLADAVPAHRVAACSIALKLSGGQRDRMRAGRPRSQGNHSPLGGESQKPSRQAKADAVGGWRVTSRKADVHPLGNSHLPESRAPAPGPGGSLESETTDYCGLSRARTLSGEAGWRQNILSILSIHVNQGSTHTRRRDQTPGASFRDLGVTSCPFVDIFLCFVQLRGLRATFPTIGQQCGPSPRSLRSFPGCT